MDGLHRLRSHEDEPAWGHLIRAGLAGGIRSYRDLGLDGAKTLKMLKFLAECDGVPLKDYAAAHSETFMLRSMAKGRKLQNAQGRSLNPGGRGARSDVLPRACQHCVSEDVAHHGYSWYRLRHNLAGVANCYIHGKQLFIAGTVIERSQFQSALGQLEARAADPKEFAYVDDFVRRYEMALLMMVQQRHSVQHWKALVEMISERMEIEARCERGTIFREVTRLASQNWLSSTFVQSDRKVGSLRNSLNELFVKPPFAYHMSLAIAAAFSDMTDMSLALRSRRCGRRILPLLKAANCKWSRSRS